MLLDLQEVLGHALDGRQHRLGFLAHQVQRRLEVAVGMHVHGAGAPALQDHRCAAGLRAGTQAGATAPNTVYGYCRVSTENQEDGTGLEAQTVTIEREAVRRDWETVELHREVVSGGKGIHQRPVLAAILERIQRGDVLVVAKGDRLARSLLVLSQLLEASDREGWSLVLIDLGVDTSTPAGRLSAQVVGAAAEYERQMIRARTREGLAVKRSQGVRLGRPVEMPATIRAEVVSLRAQGNAA